MNFRIQFQNKMIIERIRNRNRRKWKIKQKTKNKKISKSIMDKVTLSIANKKNTIFVHLTFENTPKKENIMERIKHHKILFYFH